MASGDQMEWAMRRTALVAMLAAAVLAIRPTAARPLPAPSPAMVLDTAKGPITVELYAGDAPKSVAHILDLVRAHFYRGLRFHRVTPSLVQVGDPQTRNMALRGMWGTMGSGTTIGVAELSPRHHHVRGTVALANLGDPKTADSQFYIMKTASPSLDGHYTIIGMVTSGMDIVDKLQVGDVLKNITIK
jgi:peptidylprolyl isomerase